MSGRTKTVFVTDRHDPERPEPDALPGLPHPRHTPRVIGHGAMQAQLRDVLESGRIPHGWLISGPRGVGKATLAWALARSLLALPGPGGAPGLFEGAPPPAPAVAPDLSLPPDHPVARRVAALSEPRLALVRRPWDDKTGRLRAEITVDEVRKLKAAMSLSAADTGYRAVIVDAADEMNRAAANALLKLLEEPPARTILLLIAHQPGRLLPTIRSRCWSVRLAPLSAADLAAALAQAGQDLPEGDRALARLSRLAGGSVGAAAGLLAGGGLDLYGDLLALFASMPDHDRPRALALGESLAGRDQAPRRTLALALVESVLADLARAGVTGATSSDLSPDDAAALRRLSPSPLAARAWAETQAQIAARQAHGQAVNLDPQALFLDMVMTLDATASSLRFRAGAA